MKILWKYFGNTKQILWKYDGITEEKLWEIQKEMDEKRNCNSVQQLNTAYYNWTALQNSCKMLLPARPGKM